MKYDNTLPNSTFSDTRARANRVIVASGHSNNYLRFVHDYAKILKEKGFKNNLCITVECLEDDDTVGDIVKHMINLGCIVKTSRLLPIYEPGFTSCMWVEQNGFYGALCIIFSYRIPNSGYVRYILPIKEN